MTNYKRKMRETSLLVILSFATLLVYGCNSLPVSRYHVLEERDSATLIVTGQQSTIAVAEFTSSDPGRRSFSGRPFGIMLLPESAESYIRGALVAELSKKGMYSPDAQRKISGFVDSVSLSVLGSKEGTWTIRGTVSGESGAICTVETKHRFASDWKGDVANANACEAFPSAVRAFVTAILNHPDFVRFVDGFKSSK